MNKMNKYIAALLNNADHANIDSALYWEIELLGLKLKLIV